MFHSHSINFRLRSNICVYRVALCITVLLYFLHVECGSLATVWQGYFVFLNPLDVPGWRIWDSRCGRGGGAGCQVLKRKASQWTIEGDVFGKC